MTKRVIALGFFDGVHQAHGALLKRVVEVARELEAAPCAFTFDTHPSARLTGKTVPLLNTAEERAWIMNYYYGIQEVLLASFDAMMEMSWEDFITEYLIKEQQAVHVVCGHDFHFGYKGQGKAEVLKSYCEERGLGCDIIAPIVHNGNIVSSTLIRGLLEEGEMEKANEYLGHPHVLTDTVRTGFRIGRSALDSTLVCNIDASILQIQKEIDVSHSMGYRDI